METTNNHTETDGIPELYYAGEVVEFGVYMSDAQENEFRSTFPGECCAKCRFWECYENPLWNKEISIILDKPIPDYNGSCRRHSPRIIENNDVGEDNTAFWPETRYRDWCGDFEC